MDNFIPKEKLTAYERWEMAAFDEERAQARQPPAPQGLAPPTVAAEPAPPVQISVEDVQKAFEAARAAGHEAGYASGFQEGRDAGMAEGQLAGFQAAEQIAGQMAAVAVAYQRGTEELEGRVAEELLELALHIARQVVRSSIQCRPDRVLDVVREAILALPTQHGHPTLIAHPEDASLVRTHLAEQLAHSNWRIIEDPGLERGGCRVENGASEIDATIATRWRRVVESIGSRTDWLDADDA